jgi:hypothetical protein
MVSLYLLFAGVTLVWVLGTTIRMQRDGMMTFSTKNRVAYLSMMFSIFCAAVGQAAVWPLTLLALLVAKITDRVGSNAED